MANLVYTNLSVYYPNNETGTELARLMAEALQVCWKLDNPAIGNSSNFESVVKEAAKLGYYALADRLVPEIAEKEASLHPNHRYRFDVWLNVEPAAIANVLCLQITSKWSYPDIFMDEFAGIFGGAVEYRTEFEEDTEAFMGYVKARSLNPSGGGGSHARFHVHDTETAHKLVYLAKYHPEELTERVANINHVSELSWAVDATAERCDSAIARWRLIHELTDIFNQEIPMDNSLHIKEKFVKLILSRPEEELTDYVSKEVLKLLQDAMSELPHLTMDIAIFLALQTDKQNENNR